MHATERSLQEIFITIFLLSNVSMGLNLNNVFIFLQYKIYKSSLINKRKNATLILMFNFAQTSLLILCIVLNSKPRNFKWFHKDISLSIQIIKNTQKRILIIYLRHNTLLQFFYKNLVCHYHNFLLPYIIVEEYYIKSIAFLFNLYFLCFVVDE